MASSGAHAFRVFMQQEIIQELTPKDIESLGYTTLMPLQDYGETSIRFLMKMEMRDKFSASNVLPLAEMLKNIQRNDLSKKVEKFYKLQKKKKKEQKKNDHLAAEDMVQMCHITASLQTIKLQSKILLEQMEEFHNTAHKMRHTEVETAIIDAIAIFEGSFQDKLQLVSRKMPHLRQESVDSLDSTSPQSLSSDDMQSPPGTLEREMRQRSGAVSKTRSLPRDFLEGKQPMIPPMSQTVPTAIHMQDTEEHVYEYVTARASFSPPQDTLTHYSSTDIVPSRIRLQEESQKQVVVSQDKTPKQAAKPPIARKPTKLKQNPMRSSTSSSSSLYTETCSLDTSTGDSGFVDSKQFRKECPPSVQPRHKYTPLKAEQREAVSSYATPEINGGIYDDICYDDKNQYVNHPTR